jgi:hypothetical protein
MQLRTTGITAATIAAGLFPAAAGAQTIDLTVTLPRLTVAEYHKPYVAIWLEKPGSPAVTLTVWYDQNKRNNGGAKWLSDVRMWWRAAGRTLTMPADGVSGATRAPGPQKLSFTGGRGKVPALTPGSYTLVIEAAREAGGRELVRVPFTVSAAGTGGGTAAGKSELGAVSFKVHR